nr:MAG TPA: hypothetical protein [Inoviridae sp.]
MFSWFLLLMAEWPPPIFLFNMIEIVRSLRSAIGYHSRTKSDFYT